MAIGVNAPKPMGGGLMSSPAFRIGMGALTGGWAGAGAGAIAGTPAGKGLSLYNTGNEIGNAFSSGSENAAKGDGSDQSSALGTYDMSQGSPGAAPQADPYWQQGSLGSNQMQMTPDDQFGALQRRQQSFGLR